MRTENDGSRNTGQVIPTVGEVAERVLRDFRALQCTAPAVAAGDRADLAVQFVVDCLRLLEKFPDQTRQDLMRKLPLTRLELLLAGDAGWYSSPAGQALADRLCLWIEASPVFVDERSVHVADFLRSLAPHLDYWNDRRDTHETAEHLSG